jgi:hypothetical protein
MSSQAGALTEPRATDGAGQLAHRSSSRFERTASGPKHHEERGHGWRAEWDEGAETLRLEREPDSEVPPVVPVPPVSA